MKPDWFRRRGYPHFDRRVSFKFVDGYVTDRQKVASHSFFPFISYKKIVPRYRSGEKRVEAKSRVISYAAHLDSHIYAYYANDLVKRLEAVYRSEAFGSCVLAYRTLGKSNVDFANEAFADVEQLASCEVRAFDITGFFDNLDHVLLKKSWCNLLGCDTLADDYFAVFKSITRFASVDRAALYAELGITPEKLRDRIDRLCTAQEFRQRVRGGRLVAVNNGRIGIPQGSPISAALSNVYLIEFDRKMYDFALRCRGRYRRYSDDILWICPPEHVSEIEEFVYSEIGRFRLEANPDKTEASTFVRSADGRILGSPPLLYLGFSFDGRNRLIRSKTIARYYRRLRRAVRAAKEAAALNPGDGRVYRRDLYERFTHLGRHNFLSYAYRAARKMHDGSIRRQVARHWDKLHNELDDEPSNETRPDSFVMLQDSPSSSGSSASHSASPSS